MRPKRNEKLESGMMIDIGLESNLTRLPLDFNSISIIITEVIKKKRGGKYAGDKI